MMEIRATQQAATFNPPTVESARKGKPAIPFELPRLQEQQEQKPVLNTDEKNFFEQAFPSASSAVRAYQVYTRSGARTQAQLGTMFDRKG